MKKTRRKSRLENRGIPIDENHLAKCRKDGLRAVREIDEWIEDAKNKDPKALAVLQQLSLKPQ